LCGMLSDYDEKMGGRIYALQCCDDSNAEKDGQEESKTETCQLTEGATKSFESTKSNQVVKSVTIVSMTQTTITYKITYCSYKYTKTARFSESSSSEEWKSQSSNSSSSCDCEAKCSSDSTAGHSSGEKDKGGKSKGKAQGGGSAGKGGHHLAKRTPGKGGSGEKKGHDDNDRGHDCHCDCGKAGDKKSKGGKSNKGGH